MFYQLLYTESALKDIKKLDSVVKKRIKLAIERFQKQPLLYVKRLTSPKLGEYRWRLGNYRIIFELKKNTILILRIGHRREIYR